MKTIQSVLLNTFQAINHFRPVSENDVSLCAVNRATIIPRNIFVNHFHAFFGRLANNNFTVSKNSIFAVPCQNAFSFISQTIKALTAKINPQQYFEQQE